MNRFILNSEKNKEVLKRIGKPIQTSVFSVHSVVLIKLFQLNMIAPKLISFIRALASLKVSLFVTIKNKI